MEKHIVKISSKTCCPSADWPQSERVEIDMHIDFTDATREQLEKWAAENRRISRQNLYRTMGQAAMQEFEASGEPDVFKATATQTPILTEAGRQEAKKATLDQMLADGDITQEQYDFVMG